MGTTKFFTILFPGRGLDYNRLQHSIGSQNGGDEAVVKKDFFTLFKSIFQINMSKCCKKWSRVYIWTVVSLSIDNSVGLALFIFSFFEFFHDIHFFQK
jgi:hypothetical protein